MSLSTEDERRIFSFLKTRGCCLRCCFRFLGWRATESYEDPFKIAKRIGFAVDDSKQSSDNVPCVTCLGVLQDIKQEDIVKKIEIEVAEHNYDCSTFTCALTIPVSIRLRERLMHTYCTNELELPESTLRTFKHKVQSVKDVWKWLTLSKIEKAINKCAEITSMSPLLIEVFLTYEDDEKECDSLLDTCKSVTNVNNKQRRKNNYVKYSRKNMEVLMSEITDEEFSDFLKTDKIKFEPIAYISIGKIMCSHSSIFIGGRYTKLSRALSQTPWFINGEKKMETSVQDLLCNPICEAVKADAIKFLSSGREDVDVRNIYGGRPFAVELVNPHMTNIPSELLSNLVQKINESTNQCQITAGLKVVSRDDLKTLKEGENVKTKFYRALCVCRSGTKKSVCLEKLNTIRHIKITQKTPLRVLHRRPLAPRTRCIYEIRARWVEPYEIKELLKTVAEKANMFFVIDVKTQAGTYVKEFVHGDFGRTTPSLCDLLKTEVDIVALDVTGINLDWP